MTSAMTNPVLVLNASYEPVNVTRARRAIVLLVKGTAVVEEAYERYVHVGLRLPCVIRLRQYRRLPVERRFHQAPHRQSTVPGLPV